MTYATFIQHSNKWALINENSSFQRAQAHFNKWTHLPFCGKQLIIESWIYVEITLYSNKPYDHH